MSTELLTRRMDLIHSITGKVNYLEMDTSYPVKLAGIVIKSYIATATYDYFENASSTDKTFELRNQAGETVAQFRKNQTFKFNGEPLVALPEVGEYAIVIIDLDNTKLFLCPESGFTENTGSFKDFVRKFMTWDTKAKQNTSDAIIDMTSVNPVEYYSVNAEASLHKLEISTLELNKDSGALLAIDSLPKVAQISVSDMSGNSTIAQQISPTPALYGALLNEDMVGTQTVMAPIDTNARGTLKMYEFRYGDTTTYNTAIDAAVVELNNENYSFVRDIDSKVVYELIDENTNIKSIIPVADTKVENYNGLTYCVAAPRTVCTGNYESSGEMYWAQSFVDCIISLVQVSGYFNDEFKEKFGILYGTELYNSIHQKDPTHPCGNIEYPGEYIDNIKSKGIDKDYYLVIGSVNGGDEDRPWKSQSMRRFYVRSADNRFTMSNNFMHGIRVNDVGFAINLEHSPIANYIMGSWWSAGDPDGHKHLGYGLTGELSEDRYYKIAGNSYTPYDYAVGNNEAFLTENPPSCHDAVISDLGKVRGVNTIGVSFDIDSIDNIISAINWTEDDAPARNNTWRFHPNNIDFKQLLRNIFTSTQSHFTTDIGVYRNNNNYVFVGKQGETAYPYTFGQSISTRTATGYYKVGHEYFYNGAANDYGNNRNFYGVKIVKINYPYYVDLNTKTKKEYDLTMFVIKTYFRAVTKFNGSSNLGHEIRINDDKLYLYNWGQNLLNIDGSEVTKTQFDNDRSVGNYKDYYIERSGVQGDGLMHYYPHVIRYHFGNKYTEEEPFYGDYFEVWYEDNLTSVNNNFTGLSEKFDDHYEYQFQTLRISPYNCAQANPMIDSFYIPSTCWPNAAIKYGSNNSPEWFKSLPCYLLFGSSESSINYLSYVHGGIHPAYLYNNGVDKSAGYRSIYDFITDAFCHDLGKSPEEGLYKGRVDGINTLRFFDKTTVLNWPTQRVPVGEQMMYQTQRCAAKGDTSLPFFSFNSSNTFNVYSMSEETEAETDKPYTMMVNYTNNRNNKINVVKTQTGIHESLSISLTDDTGARLNLEGTDSNMIETQYLNWAKLLEALNNNKSINLLGSYSDITSNTQTIINDIEENPSSNPSNYFINYYDVNDKETKVLAVGEQIGQLATTLTQLQNMLINDDEYENHTYTISFGYNNGKFGVLLNDLEPGKYRAAINHAELSANPDYVPSFTNGQTVTARFFKRTSIPNSVNFTITLDPFVTFTASLGYPNPEPDDDHWLKSSVTIDGIPFNIARVSGENYVYMVEGFQNVFGKKFFYERSLTPLKLGFFEVTDSAVSVGSLFGDSEEEYFDDPCRGTYYATINRGIYRSCTEYITLNKRDYTGSKQNFSFNVYDESTNTYNRITAISLFSSFTSISKKFTFDQYGRITKIE